MDLKITNVEAIALRAPMKEKIRNSFGVMEFRSGMIIKIFTSSGIIGLGETWVNFPSWAVDERKATIEKGVKPLLMGEDPLQVQLVWNKLYKALARLGTQWGARGLIIQAISGVEIALWDIFGKFQDKPLYQLLGGPVQKRVKPYGSLPPGNLEAAMKCRNMGMNFYKLKVGLGEEIDTRNITEVKQVIGTDAGLAVDANMAWTPEQALKMIRQWEPLGLAFVEEPVLCDDIEGLAFLSQHTSVPIAAGENVYTRYEFKKLIERRAVSIVQPDVTRTGGIFESKIIAAMADAWGLKWAPHFYSHAVGLAATLHLLASTPGGLFLEYDATENALRDCLLKRPLQIQDGYLDVPELPGLGIELNEDAVREYAIK